MDNGMVGPAGAIPTRADLIEYGVLVDVPAPVARAAGITVPVAFSAPAWQTYVGDEPEGQLPAVLAAVVRSLTRAPHAESLVITGAPTVSGQPALSHEQLHGEAHPGDAGEPALLLLLPGDY
ncbi:hypothetical protein ABZ135_32930 [Streptomyces sp. NPDC006339]|uniref:hypothetical protein n=1 Tax=Streptomyces sp. NPDC006339 TaxID=3156755 RepID=UPI0033B850A9